jgi:hypothetical protein
VNNVLVGFDSHALPPVQTNAKVLVHVQPPALAIAPTDSPSNTNDEKSVGESPTPFADVNKLTKLTVDFIASRQQGLSPRTIDWYKQYLHLSRKVVGLDITPARISPSSSLILPVRRVESMDISAV